MKQKILIILIICLILIPLVSSAPPITQVPQFTTGYTIKIPTDNILKVGGGVNFNIHVYNISNGVPIVNNIGCYMHLYNSTGDHINIAYDDIISENFDYEFSLNGNNFTTESVMALFQCNSSVLGGFTEEELIITNNGLVAIEGIPNSIYYIGFLFLAVILFAFTLYGGIAIPFSNKTNEEGKIIDINDLKYVKILLLGLSYLILMFIFGFSRGIAYNYLIDLKIYNVFYWAYTIMLSALYPIIVAGILIAVISFLTDKKLQKAMERGIQDRW